MRTQKITIIVPLGKNRETDFIKTFQKDNRIRTIVVEGTNPSRNRNIGAKKAETDLIAFVDGHTILSKNWVDSVLEFFNKHSEIDIVGGPQLNYDKDNFFAKTSGYALSSKFGAANVTSRYSAKKINLNADETMLTTANLICRKKVLEKVQFDETIYPGEDPKFIFESKSAGFKIAYSPNIRVYHRRRDSMRGLIKQIFAYGSKRTQKETINETLKKPFFLVPSLFVIYLIFLTIFSLISGTNGYFLFPLIMYTFLNLISSLGHSIKNKIFLGIFLLPLIYLAIHMSYGTGIIYGYIKKHRLF